MKRNSDLSALIKIDEVSSLAVSWGWTTMKDASKSNSYGASFWDSINSIKVKLNDVI